MTYPSWKKFNRTPRAQVAYSATKDRIEYNLSAAVTEKHTDITKAILKKV